MTEESPGVPLDDEALHALLDRPFTELTPEELAALKAAFEARGYYLYSNLAVDMITPLMTVGAVYTKAFVETLAKYHADVLSDAATRFRRKGKTREVLVGPDDGSAATIIITERRHDEARLALLDLQVTADELRGKVLRWDEKAMAGVPTAPTIKRSPPPARLPWRVCS